MDSASPPTGTTASRNTRSVVSTTPSAATAWAPALRAEGEALSR
ncbi:hypothetical protein [Umezawaea sp.]